MVDLARSDAVLARYRSLVDGGAPPSEWAFAWRTEINRGGFDAYDFLMREVVDTGKCVGCAACVTICPTDVFDYVGEEPVDTRPEACVHCVLCADVCPVLSPPDHTIADVMHYREPKLDEGYGIYAYECLVRATKPEITARAQDGGLISAILLHQLERGGIKGAVIGDVLPDDPQIGIQRLATTPQAILDARGSRYTYSPNTVALREAIEKDIKPIAVVGVPCQVDGVRQQQHSGIRLAMNKWYRENIKLVLGLFCSEAFTHESIAAVARDYGRDRKEIDNINIKGKVIIRFTDGVVEQRSLKEFQQYARPACLYCQDYSTDQADIGAGGIGLDGWTYTVVRTEAGHEAFQACLDDGWLETRPVSDAPRSKPLLQRLAGYKRDKLPPPLLPTVQERRETGQMDPKGFRLSKMKKQAEAEAAARAAAAAAAGNGSGSIV